MFYRKKCQSLYCPNKDIKDYFRNSNGNESVLHEINNSDIEFPKRTLYTLENLQKSGVPLESVSVSLPPSDKDLDLMASSLVSSFDSSSDNTIQSND